MNRFLRVRVLGHDVRVAIRPGTEPGPPLVLCNGIGASLDLLQPFVDEVDPRIEVVRFDVPGVGGSPDPKVPYTFATLACFVATLVDRLGYDRFDVLGISWGGGLAQQLAFQNPRRCRRLVLVSTGTGMLMVPARPSVLNKMVTPRRYRDPAYATGHRTRAVRRPDAPAPRRGQARGLTNRSASGRGPGTSCSSWPASAGRACPHCRSSGSAPSSSPATTTRSSRS